MSRFNTIFFDWGGVIASDPGDDFLALLLKNLGASEREIEEILRTYKIRFMTGHISEAEYWAALKARYGLTIHDTISDEFKKWKGLVTNDAVFGLVDKAKARGLQAALLTNVLEPTYNVLSQAGYYDRFDNVIASCKVGFAKPQKEIYELALKRLHTTPSQSIFIDDKQRNLDPAIEMGFTAILARSPKQIIEDVMRCLED